VETLYRCEESLSEVEIHMKHSDLTGGYAENSFKLFEEGASNAPCQTCDREARLIRVHSASGRLVPWHMIAWESWRTIKPHL
jgi:hypothetical protein